MKIVLDSNIIIADFWLQSTNFKILFESVKKGNLEVYIPEIVLDEVVNKYDSRINKSKNDIESELKTFHKLTKEKQKFTISDELLQSCLSKYQEHLQKIVKENNIIVLPYPKTEHKLLANKAMLKLKPFNSNEKGYRDCLIWENIKSLLTEEEAVVALPELVFVTNNYKDFATPEFELHSDLIKELENEDFDPDSVRIYQNLSEFNEKQVKLFFTQANTFEKKLKDGNIYDFKLLNVTNEYLQEDFIGSQLSHYESDYEDDFSEPTVRGFEDEYNIEITSVKKMTANEYIVDVEFEIDTEIDFFMEKSEYWSLGEDKKGISVEDADWNRHMMWVCSNTDISISMTIILDTNLEVISCQINKVNKNYAQQYV